MADKLKAIADRARQADKEYLQVHAPSGRRPSLLSTLSRRRPSSSMSGSFQGPKANHPFPDASSTSPDDALRCSRPQAHAHAGPRGPMLASVSSSALRPQDHGAAETDNLCPPCANARIPIAAMIIPTSTLQTNVMTRPPIVVVGDQVSKVVVMRKDDTDEVPPLPRPLQHHESLNTTNPASWTFRTLLEFNQTIHDVRVAVEKIYQRLKHVDEEE
jgi:hypothetical protein